MILHSGPTIQKEYKYTVINQKSLLLANLCLEHEAFLQNFSSGLPAAKTGNSALQLSFLSYSISMACSSQHELWFSCSYTTVLQENLREFKLQCIFPWYEWDLVWSQTLSQLKCTVPVLQVFSHLLTKKSTIFWWRHQILNCNMHFTLV